MSRIVLITLFLVVIFQVVYETENFWKQKNFLTPEEYNGYTEELPDGVFNYWIQARLNPILALPTLRPQEFDDSIEFLESSVEVFKKNYTDNEYQQITSSLFPISSLKTIRDTELNRQNFVAYPTKENALIYHQSLVESLEAYKTDLDKLTKIFESLDGKKIAFINGMTSSSHIAKTLRSLSEQIEVAKSLEDVRYACTLKYERSCPDLEHIFATDYEIFNIKTTSSDVVPAEATVYSDILKKYYDINPEAEKNQPVFIQADSYCYNYEQPVLNRIWWPKSQTTDIEIIKTTATNDLMLQQTELMTDNPYHKAQFEAGVLYDIQDTAAYFCIDYGIDIGRIATAYYIYEILKDKPLLNQDYEIEELLYAKKIEARIISQNIVHLSELSEYFRTLELALSKYGERGMQKELGIYDYDKLLNIRSIWKTQSGFLEANIANMAELTKRLEGGILPRTKIPLDALFITRSYMSSLYLIANTTLYRNTKPTSFLKLHEPVALNNFGIKSYKNDISYALPLEQLENYLSEYVTLIRKVNPQNN